MATPPTAPAHDAAPPTPRYLTWADIGSAVQVLAERVTTGGPPQAVVGIMRGGMVPAVWLAHRLKIRDVRSIEVVRTTGDIINADKNPLPDVHNPASLGDLRGLDVLLVDDIAGSGVTLAHTADMLRDLGTARLRTAVLAVNRANWEQDAHPADAIDHIAALYDTWIVFPWEGTA
ncbi:purine phosphoribosyltransferase [Streptomyces kaniharaensis]|uniref:Purine phosphoribosyltransferase n=1 Tax=Streptomyces kaniharaensis TaxID=212423 RepID=A0A6N7L4M8_9ACTN|nr:phosphoribosyltransferase family protein [Streptomyces kaniharaensis]MQS17608.1 purine phosphoribosyltransferase [Streptomyces kaniharaensis]